MLPYKSLISFDRNSSVAVYVQLCNQFIALITKGLLKPKAALPSSRKLAGLLGVNRNTIKLAYDELISQGWAEPVDRTGIFVLSKLPETMQAPLVDAPREEDLKEAFVWNKPNTLRLRSTTEYKQQRLKIDDGFPDVRLTPIDTLMREYRSISKKYYGKSYLKYGNPKGSKNLRNSISDYLSKTRGFTVDPEDILVTKGSQMGIYLVTELVLTPQDTIAVGMSNYFAADHTFQNRGANLLRIPVDAEGMDTDYLEECLQSQKIKAVYIIPHHHWPTTVTLSMERRLKLLNLAKEYRFAIIEDDYDFDFHYRNKPYLPMASIDHNRSVLYIGSLCKTFAPGIRIGFLAGSSDFINAATSVRSLIDRQGDTLLEEALSAMYDNGEMERHFRKSVKIYQERRDLFCRILKDDFHSSLHFTTPEGGMAVWTHFDEDINLMDVVQKVNKHGMDIPNPEIYKNEVFSENSLRLGFASLQEKEIITALDILKKGLTS
ncbi:PLP-dependent aminotransferase family protein [Rapidithrix thailandica]|uniref:PLP-dependent aminotransferase family protein n=1 Tax=Rapidithrix thailandica TaxID=413964 RepID=A0AAW9S5R4_9BACT